MRMSNRGSITALAVLVPLILLLPAVAWVWQDNGPIFGDDAIYGLRTLGLFHILSGPPSQWSSFASPRDWGSLPMASYEFNPPGTVWFGQLFVFVGRSLGSIKAGLRASILATQWLSLALMFWLLWEMTSHKVIYPMLGCILVAASPAFAGMSVRYMTEPLQLLAATWFLFVVILGEGWSPALVLSHLLGATTIAVLAKFSAPLHLLVPGLVALWRVVRSRPPWNSWGWAGRSTVLTLALVLPLVACAAIWYANHLPVVVGHALIGAFSEKTAPWIRQAPYLETLMHWLDQMRAAFLPYWFTQIPILGLCVVGVVCSLSASKIAGTTRLWIVLGVVQIGATLAVFSLSTNQEARFLLPLLPYLAVAVCMTLVAFNRPILTALTLVAFAVQFALVQTQALGVLTNFPKADYWLPSPRGLGQRQALAESIVRDTCPEGGPASLNVIAANAIAVGPEVENYIVARDLTLGMRRSCSFVYMGMGYWGLPAAEAWNSLLSKGVDYVVIQDPAIYPPSPTAANESMRPENLPEILRRLESSGEFEMLGRFPEDAGMLLFHRASKR